MNIESIVEALDDIKNVGSTKQKEVILKSELTANPELRYILNAALASDLRFGVTVHEKDVFTITEQATFVNTLDHLIKNRPHNSNEKKNLLLGMISGIEDKNQRDLMIRIANKDLNIGIGLTIINKVLNALDLEPIRNLEPLKAFKEKDTDLPDLVDGKTVYVQEKIDAARSFMIIDPENEIGYFLTSTGRRIDSFGHITYLPMKMGVQYNKKAPFVVDGELVALEDDGEYMARKKSNGLLNKAGAGTIKEQDANRFVFVAWDLMFTFSHDLEFPLYNGSKECDGKDYYLRFDTLSNLIKAMDMDTSWLLSNSVRRVPSGVFSGMRDVYEEASHYLDAGKEGVIVRSMTGHYVPKRSRNLVKIKKSFMADVRVTGINEGKNAGTLGSLQYATDDGLVKGDVSGIGDKTKEAWWKDPQSIIGQVIEVRYMEVTTDKRTGDYTLYGPAVFIRERHDKNETSTLEQLS